MSEPVKSPATADSLQKLPIPIITISAPEAPISATATIRRMPPPASKPIRAPTDSAYDEKSQSPGTKHHSTSDSASDTRLPASTSRDVKRHRTTEKDYLEFPVEGSSSNPIINDYIRHIRLIMQRSSANTSLSPQPQKRKLDCSEG